MRVFGAYAGYELSLFLFPYAEKSKKWLRYVHVGNAITVSIYLIVSILSYGYFNSDELTHIAFPLLDMYAYLRFPFVERVQNFLFSVFLFSILQTAGMYYWSSQEVLSQVFRRINWKVLILVTMVMTILISLIPKTLIEVEGWFRYFTMAQLAFSAGFPLLLIILLLLQRGRKNMRKRIGLLCASACLLLAGCAQDQRILERIGYVETAAFDASPEGKIKVTVSIPLVTQFAKNGETTDELLTTVAKSPKEANKELGLRTSRIIVSGQIRTLMFGEALARMGLWKHMDTFYRDPTISQRTSVVVVEGDAGTVISQEFPRHTKTANYINKLLQKEYNRQGSPRTMLHQFVRDYFDDGQDPIAVMIKEQKKDITVSGLAMFQKDRMVEKFHVKTCLSFL